MFKPHYCILGGGTPIVAFRQCLLMDLAVNLTCGVQCEPEQRRRQVPPNKAENWAGAAHPESHSVIDAAAAAVAAVVAVCAYAYFRVCIPRRLSPPLPDL